MTLTGVGAIICAAHKCDNGILHGHTWEVTAWFTDGDAVDRQKELQTLITEKFDHVTLHGISGRGEWMAQNIGQSLNCAQVDVSRPLERIYARWNR